MAQPKNFALRLPAELKAELEEEATRQDRSLNWLIVEACRSFMRQPVVTSVTTGPDPGREVEPNFKSRR